jgi:hypothetical protein
MLGREAINLHGKWLKRQQSMMIYPPGERIMKIWMKIGLENLFDDGWGMIGSVNMTCSWIPVKCLDDGSFYPAAGKCTMESAWMNDKRVRQFLQCKDVPMPQ